MTNKPDVRQQLAELFNNHRILGQSNIAAASIGVEKRFMGLIKINQGWVNIHDRGNQWHVAQNDVKGWSDLTTPPCYGALIDKETGDLYYTLIGVWESAVKSGTCYRDFPDTNEEAQAIFDRVKSAINQAYEFNKK